MNGPPPAVAAVRSAVRAVLDGAPVLVACSGGADSLALAAATAFAAPRAGVRAGLVSVDHGVQDGSAEQAARVAAIGRDLGLDPVLHRSVRIAGRPGGLEAALRAARYELFDGLAEQHEARILLGHTLDDQAETVLLGLGRGSGPRAIAGMPARRGPYRRPLLRLRRTTTRAACAALGLDAWDDPTNLDPAFRRNRLRHEVLPLLEDVLQGGVAEALARTGELLRDDLDALDAWAAEVVRAQTRSDVAERGQLRGETDGGEVGLEVAALAGLPRAVRTRVLRLWATAPGTEPLSAERTAALDALVTDWHGQGAIDLPGRCAVVRRSGRLVKYAPDPQE